MIRAQQLDGWVPMRVFWQEGRPLVDWCYLGTRRFAEPFFEDTIGAAMRLPFNLVFRQQTPIEVLAEWQALRPGVAPTGFIFHMSRCGSTLIAQMLAALARNVVLSEAVPIDGVVRAHFRSPEATEARRRAWLRGMVSALGQRRRGDETGLFIKFDSWHSLDLPLIRQAFPDVPWLFVYRNPVEVLVSQMKRRGAQMVAGMIEPALMLGIPPAEAARLPPEEYCARALRRVCEAALNAHAQGGGLLVNYAQLPDAVPGLIADHCGVPLSDEDRATMRHVAQFDAKNPHFTFQTDTADKRKAATDLIYRMVEEWVSPVFDRLESVRQAGALRDLARDSLAKVSRRA